MSARYLCPTVLARSLDIEKLETFKRPEVESGHGEVHPSPAFISKVSLVAAGTALTT